MGGTKHGFARILGILGVGIAVALAGCGGGDTGGGSASGDGGGDAAVEGGTDGASTDGGDTDGASTDGGGSDGSTATPCSSGADCNDMNPCNGMEACIDGACAAGTAPAEGSSCEADGDPATRELCIGEVCVPSTCGDGFTDADAGEACDDGNDVSGDGCEADCTFSCVEDGDCDDGNECNGEERCDTDTHTCTPGTPLEDGADCAGGAGSCFGGVCGPRACENDTECDDGDPCNGAETCSGGRCTAGTALDCDDGDACTADACVPGVGCSNVLIDADGDGQASTTLGACGTDCDDTDPDVYAGAPEVCDGIDNDCDGATDEDSLVAWYADCDGDGFAASGAARVESCSLPPVSGTGCTGGGGTWTTTAPTDGQVDCNDANPAVFPGQSSWFDTPISGAPEATDFDYNCDGTEERRYEGGGCTGNFFGCRVRRGFAVVIPGCGQSGRLVTECSYNRMTRRCEVSETVEATQRCR